MIAPVPSKLVGPEAFDLFHHKTSGSRIIDFHSTDATIISEWGGSQVCPSTKTALEAAPNPFSARFWEVNSNNPMSEWSRDIARRIKGRSDGSSRGVDVTSGGLGSPSGWRNSGRV